MPIPIEKRVYFNLFLAIIEIESLNCWQGTEGGSTPATSGPCAGDTCKAIIVFPSGFLSLPSTSLTCVTATDDTDPATCASGDCSNQGCANCTLNQLQSLRGCVLNSADGTIVTYCAQVTDGNQPRVTSCYQGTFLSTNVNALPSTTCTPTTTSYEFCKLDNSNNANAPIGSCATTCITSDTVACCNINGCNKPLVCATGNYYVNAPSTSNYATTVCPIYNSPSNLNLYCKIALSYSSTLGVTLTGSCENTCTNSLIYYSTTGASGTFCCTGNLCNGPSAIRSYLSRASKLYLAITNLAFSILLTNLILIVMY